MFFRKPTRPTDYKTTRFYEIVNLVKDLDTTEFNRLVDSMKLARESYQKLLKVRTIEEKANDFEDIERIESNLENLAKT